MAGTSGLDGVLGGMGVPFVYVALMLVYVKDEEEVSLTIMLMLPWSNPAEFLAWKVCEVLFG